MTARSQANIARDGGDDHELKCVHWVLEHFSIQFE